MKHVIFKRNEDGTLGEKLGSYEGPKDDTSANRSYLMAEPLACHIELPVGMDEDCVVLVGNELQEDTTLVAEKRQKIANSKLDEIRKLREPLLREADIEILKLEDAGGDASLLRAYRVALRACTDDLKKISGDAKLACENLVPSEFVFPVKP